MIELSTQGHRISEARTRLGLSQRLLARRAGLSLATLNRIEAGVCAATMCEMWRVASALGTSVTSLCAERPLAARVQFAHRTTGPVDASPVHARLIQLLEIEELLTARGVPQVQ
jgi:transcriptional regulator with XRE-family HTH domain